MSVEADSIDCTPRIQETTYTRPQLLLQLVLKTAKVKRFWLWFFIVSIHVLPDAVFVAFSSSIVDAALPLVVMPFLPLCFFGMLWHHLVKHNTLSLLVTGEELTVVRNGGIMAKHRLSECRWHIADQVTTVSSSHQPKPPLQPRIIIQCPFCLWEKASWMELFCGYTPDKAEAWEQILSGAGKHPRGLNIQHRSKGVTSRHATIRHE